tara:strand:+ start:115 stop:834 length:720 start_codon:yes stop_codon:yes gene_type:complete
MSLEIFITILITTIIQSIFGVGVLLFGTPLLLLFGFDFITTLTILLPVSLIINSFQLVVSYKNIDFVFYKKMLFYTVPFIVLFLFFVTSVNVNINLFVGCFLILIALQRQFPTFEKQINKMMKFETIYLSIMGLIHGLTNLGGSLLTAIISNKKLSKEKSRATIAVCYLTFALFQIITLYFINNNFNINFINYGIYWLFGAVIFFIVEKQLYNKIDDHKYSILFRIFLLGSGLLLLAKY